MQRDSFAHHGVEKVYGEPVAAVGGEHAERADVELRGGEEAAADCGDEAGFGLFFFFLFSVLLFFVRGGVPQRDQGYAVVRLGHCFLVEGVWVRDWQCEGVEVLEGREVLGREGRELDVRREGA